jgi:hypothetical protein
VDFRRVHRSVCRMANAAGDEHAVRRDVEVMSLCLYCSKPIPPRLSGRGRRASKFCSASCGNKHWVATHPRRSIGADSAPKEKKGGSNN